MDIESSPSSPRRGWVSILLTAVAIASFAAVSFDVYVTANGSSGKFSFDTALQSMQPRRLLESSSKSSSNSNADGNAPRPLVTVYRISLESHPSNQPSHAKITKAILRKQEHELKDTLSADIYEVKVHTVTNEEDMMEFIKKSSALGELKAPVEERLTALIARGQIDLAMELWKYCALLQSPPSHKIKPGQVSYASAVIEPNSPVMTRFQDILTVAQGRSVAVTADPRHYPDAITTTFLLLTDKRKKKVAKTMIKLLINTDIATLEANPLLLQRKLFSLVSGETIKRSHHRASTPLTAGTEAAADWYILQQDCTMDPLLRPTDRTDRTSLELHQCPPHAGFCCAVHDAVHHRTFLLHRKPLIPTTFLPESLPLPYNSEVKHYNEDEVAFIATITEERFERKIGLGYSNSFYDILNQNSCLPDDACNLCLRQKTGANCEVCAEKCACYCNSLCHEPLQPKHVSKHFIVKPPLYQRDPSRLIPRIVHQTWYEDVGISSRERYPNMSRLVESFKTSGWEYRFYSDEDAGSFLSTHFPTEVREAYDALIPGAFKADLFRYCVLLIHGGVYADVDIHLESNLEFSVPADVGFMVPVDEPGKPVDKQMCLWNGIMAVAPGHPFLLKAIETVVNQVRNRFTVVDVDQTFCPDPELSIMHAFDTLFTAGPCLLGSAVNRALGRRGQEAFVPGEMNPKVGEAGYEEAMDGTSFVKGSKDLEDRIPGKTVILRQNKWDMGAHRFTMDSQNLVVAATDLPNSDDRSADQDDGAEAVATPSGNHQHYSKAHAKTGTYGLQNLYTDDKRANEEIRMILDVSGRVAVDADVE